MNLNKKIRLESTLKIMDLNEIKPCYAQLAREYGLDYRTVKKYHDGYEGKSKKRDKPSKLDKHKQVIEEKLQLSRVTKRGVYEWLGDTYGFEEIGTYSNFKAYCKKNKLKSIGRDSAGGTLYETDPGDLAECDWKEDIKLISRNGEVFMINIFHLVLKFSRYSYIEMTLSKEQPVVFRCLINAFKFYGGMPDRILFDNMSTVMDVTVRPKRVNSKMVQFAKDMNFTVNSCKSRHACTKGTNESRNKIMDWLRPYNNEFDSFDDLRKIVDTLNVKMNTEVCQGTGLKPCLLFFKEKEYLNPLPDTSIMDDYLAPTKVKVSPQQLITYKGIKYSVDKKYVDEFVYLEEFDNKLQIYYKGDMIQIHQISNNPVNYIKEHYTQSLKNTMKEEKINECVTKNLNAFDKLLENRTVTLTKDDACKSTAGMLAYLTSFSSLSNGISRIIQSLTKDDRRILLEELKLLLPYVTNEEQFFYAFKHAVKNNQMKYVRLDFWELDLMECYNFLSQEGYDIIRNDFEKEYEERLRTMKDRW